MRALPILLFGLFALLWVGFAINDLYHGRLGELAYDLLWILFNMGFALYHFKRPVSAP